MELRGNAMKLTYDRDFAIAYIPINYHRLDKRSLKCLVFVLC